MSGTVSRTNYRPPPYDKITFRTDVGLSNNKLTVGHWARGVTVQVNSSRAVCIHVDAIPRLLDFLTEAQAYHLANKERKE